VRVEVGPHVFGAAKGVSAASIRQMLEAHSYTVYATQEAEVGGDSIRHVSYMALPGKSPYS
jgi:hypothetical protein